MSLKYLLAAASMAMLLGVGTSAKALETEWLFTGTVSDFFDSTGETFGENGANLDGANFVATYYINTNVGAIDIVNGNGDLDGGPLLGNQSPVSASIEINGATQYFPGSTALFADASFTNIDVYSAGIDEPFLAGSNELGGSGIVNYGGPACMTNSCLANNGINNFGQSFNITNELPNSTPNSFDLKTATGNLLASGTLDVTNVSSPGIVNFTSAAPEPSSWLLMIAGVGLAGLMLRRRVRIDPLPPPVAAHV